MSDYHASQNLIARAEAAIKEGHIERGRALFGEAATIQKRLVESVPRERVRTRSAFGLSAAALFYKANALGEAERLAHLFMAEEALDQRSRQGLQELLARIWNERRTAESGLLLAGPRFSLVLFGRAIHHGLAPWEVVDVLTKTFINYMRRIGAWRNGQPFKPQERTPSRGIEECYLPLASEPVSGSYRIDLCLAQQQGSLDLDGAAARPASPSDIVDTSIRFARMVEQGHERDISRLVTDEMYRGALIRLVGAMVPDGHAVGEVQIRNPDEDKELAIRFLPQHRAPVKRLFRTLGPAGAQRRGEPRSSNLRGTLRAVDLDDGKLRLVAEGEDPKEIEINEVLYDVIGPMLNKNVVVQARMPARRTKTWIADDIELAGEEDEGPEES